MHKVNHFSYYTLIFLLFSCTQKEVKIIGTIERLDPAIDGIISDDAIVEIIAEGFNWSEGPIWIDDPQMLIFSDVPENTIYKWTEAKGKEIYLTPSGYTERSGPSSKGEGSNGLALSNEGKLVICQHGDRRVAQLDAPLNDPQPNFITIADNYRGARLNSPNDAVFSSHGDLFFTDPPYGLPSEADKELMFHGVYKVSGGQISLITDSLTRPNGIGLMPGEKTLVVANSDPNKALWYAFDLLENDSVGNARIFYDGRENAKTDKGNPDGLTVDKVGNVFATGPGGVWIFDKTGKALGRIKISELTSNCCLSSDQKTLYITADMYLVRVQLRD